jgi:glycosyltransferase involved in cell wall biosynthesis
VHVDHESARSVRSLRRLAPGASIVLDFTGLPEGLASSAARRARNADLLLFPSLRDLSEARRRFPSVLSRSALLRPPVTHVPGSSTEVPLEWQDASPLVLYDGPLTAAGGLDAALGVACRLVGSGLAVRFVALGRGQIDRRYVETCRLAAAPLADRLLVLEHPSAQSVTSSWYQRADVVCLPPRGVVDPIPAKLAAVSATPIVVTEVENLLEYVDDETSVLVPVDDPHALYAGVLRVLHDPALAERLAAAARSRAERELSPRAAARRLIDLWNTAAVHVAAVDGRAALVAPVAAGAHAR